MIRKIENSIVEDSAKAILSWLSKSRNEEIQKLRSSNLQVGNEVMNYANNLQLNEEETKKRIQIINQIIDETNSTEIFVDAAMAISRLSAFTDNQLKNKKERLSISEMDENVNPHRKQIIESTRQAVVLQFLYNYRENSLDNLRSYLSFLKEPVGNWYTKMVYQSYKETVGLASEEYIDKLKKIDG